MLPAFSVIGNIVLKGSNDNLTWITAASSNFRLVERGVRFLDGPARRDLGLRYDYTAPWPLVSRTICTSLFFALGCIGTALNGALASLLRVDTRALGKAVFGSFCLALSLQSLVAGAGFLALDAPDAAFLPFNEAAAYLALAAMLIRFEAFFFDSLGSVAWYLLACRAAADWLIFHDPGYLLADPPVEAIAFALVAAVFLKLRKRFLYTAVIDVEQDRAALDAAWARLLAEPEEREAIERLAAAADRAAGACAGAHARQLNRARRAGAGAGPGILRRLQVMAGWLASARADRGVAGALGGPGPGGGPGLDEDGADGSVAGEVDPGAPVGSIDQLYSQVGEGTWSNCFE